VQESITGSRFEGSYQLKDGAVWPSITGSAFVTLEGILIFPERDPFRWGIRMPKRLMCLLSARASLELLAP